MAKLAATDGFQVSGWMRLNLGLSAGELLAYAIVYQFSQKGGAGVYTGGVPYMSSFIGCTEDTARKYLKSLTSRGLIFKINATTNGVPYQNYKANPALVPEIAKYTPEKLGGTPEKKQGTPTPEKLGVDNNNKKINNTTGEEGANSAPHTPTLNEVAAYAQAQGFTDPAGFADYYIRYQTENGWMTGKGKNRKPIDNWKLNVLAWRKNHKDEIFSKKNETTATRIMTSDQFKQMFK